MFLCSLFLQPIDRLNFIEIIAWNATFAYFTFNDVFDLASEGMDHFDQLFVQEWLTSSLHSGAAAYEGITIFHELFVLGLLLVAFGLKQLGLFVEMVILPLDYSLE